MKLNRIAVTGPLIIIGLFILFVSGCKKNNPLSPATKTDLPSLYTSNITITTDTSFVCGGNVMKDGRAPVTERGVCWSVKGTPTIDSNKIALGSGPGRFSQILLGITGSTVYYIRSYAINSVGIAYGNEVQYSTPKLAPRIYTMAPTSTLSTSAILTGKVLYDGGEPVVSRGFFWTTNAAIDPIAGTRINSGTGTGAFNYALGGLVVNTNYYYRAFALNGSRWGYGNIKSFTLTQQPAADTIMPPNSLSQTGAMLLGKVNPNGLPTTVYFEWGPTTAYGNTAQAISGPVTSFSTPYLQISGLTTFTLYHYRLKTVNSLGTVYSEDMPFYTQRQPGTLMAGGIVFYSDYLGHGIVCAETDQSPAAPWWKNDGTPMTDVKIYYTQLGKGQMYTDSICKVQGNGFYAAKICQDLVLNGYSDWYLPTRGELSAMQGVLAQKNIGNFAKAKYWSCEESMILFNRAEAADFSNGTLPNEPKTSNLAVRACRAF